MVRLSSVQQRVLDKAAEATLERIDADLARASWKCRPLLRHIREHFLSEGYGAKILKSAFGGREPYVLEYFRSELGMAPTNYITAVRIETAARLLRDTDLSIGAISLLVGYNDTPAFRDAFRRTVHLLPSKFRNCVRSVVNDFGWPQSGDPLELRVWDELAHGTVEPSKRRQLSVWFKKLYDVGPSSLGANSETELLVSFFQILGKKSLEEGRLDRQRGIELAQMALDFVETNSEAMAEEAAAARSLGWARLANAFRLANRFPDAASAFTHTKFASSRTLFSQRSEAEILFLKGTFLQFQRCFSEARKVLKQGLVISRFIDDRLLGSKLLIQIAKLDDYANDHHGAIDHLRKALSCISGSDDSYIRAVAYGNLAASYVWAGKSTAALTVLPDAFSACNEIGSSFNICLLHWIAGLAKQLEGDAIETERLFRRSRGGLVELGEIGYVGIISLELAVLCQQQERWAEAVDLAAEALPPLRAFELPELISALNVLSTSLASNELTLTSLQMVRDGFRSVYRDPTCPLRRGAA